MYFYFVQKPRGLLIDPSLALYFPTVYLLVLQATDTFHKYFNGANMYHYGGLFTLLCYLKSTSIAFDDALKRINVTLTNQTYHHVTYGLCIFTIYDYKSYKSFWQCINSQSPDDLEFTEVTFATLYPMIS